MARRNGPWTIEETTEQYRNQLITVREDRVTQPDGEPGSYATVEMQPGVAVLPVDRDGVAHLTRQFRYALGRESVEVVSGATDEGEDPLEAARREAQEELGITAEDWIDLGRMDMDTSVVRGSVRLFLARELGFTETEQEGTETIEPLEVPLAEAVRMVLESEITHSPSCVLILKAGHRLGDRPTTERSGRGGNG